MEETEPFKTFPLIDADMFKKQLKNYYVLFSQQQTTAKQPKKKKKDVIIEEEESSGAKSKKKNVIIVSEDSKLHQFKVSFHSTVNGIIEFNHNPQKLALEFNVNNPKTKKIYKEIIYLPVVVDVKEILTTVQNLKHDIYLEYSKGKITEEDLSKDFDYFELIALENELLEVIRDLKQDTIHNLNAELETENELLIKYRTVQTQLQTQMQTQMQSTEYQNAMREYLMVNQTLNHVDDDNGNIIIYPGTRVSLNEKHGIITKIDNTLSQYHIKFDGSSEEIEIIPIPKKTTGLPSDLMILDSVRNSISKSKNKILNLSINLAELIKTIHNKRILIDVLTVLNINLSIPEITNRPRLEIYTNIDSNISKKVTIIDKINTFFSNIELSDIFNKRENIIIGKKVKDTPNNMDINLSNWRQLFSMDDMSIPFTIDDFQFNSIKHYHISSRFYNREDLSVNLKMEYNNFFLKFTNDFNGIGSLSKIETHLLYIYIDNYTFKKPINWSMNTIKGDSLESIYLKKAYYNKFNQNSELRTALIKTYPKIIYERISKNKLLINYELMLVRYYLYNNIIPHFNKFNYNPSLYKLFISDTSETKEYEQRILLHIFLKYDAYQNREHLFLNSEILYSEYNRLDISGKTSFQLLTKYFHELLFSYNSVFIYELIFNYITNDPSAHKTIDTFIKKYDLFLDESKSIFYFCYEYITSILITKEQVIQEDLLLERELEEKYRALQATLKANNYLIVEGAFRFDESFLDSIIEFLNRNKFKPFDLSSHTYPYSEQTNFKNVLFNKKEFTIYHQANNYLYSLISELYNINNTSEKSFDETDYFERLEILSRLLSLDILIISEDAIQEIKMKDTLDKYGNILQDKIMPYAKSRGRLVLGHINDTDYFFSTKPYFASQERENIKYLIASDTKYVIEEETSHSGDKIHTIIGKWNPENLELDTKDTEPGDKLNGDINIEDFMLYRLGERIYFKDRELYF